MCLGIPCRVIDVEPDGQQALIETAGLRQKVGIQLVGAVQAGEYLIVHAGYAIEKLDLEEAGERLRLLEEFLRCENEAAAPAGAPGGSP
ncbi:HypC/HybG/HupF family hydrogenase formation chaperone [Desulfotomaculum copahuensis]|uniref:Hydrogenase assembly protein HypC n=1 Tax=Desulfotomaculum copahuensis TaxID=1838280 RepID=A0A1B7LH92_9FIRM|nr:HypC/HybG/HupF family hydrogenase formation chaperone [Desulfotomaculum copahuensis]OAT85574.1 hydrogenase assembly protein HypC [Desulfotomaculum copahuensis]